MEDTYKYNITEAIRKLFRMMKMEKREIFNIYLYAIIGGLIQLSLPLGLQAIIGLLFAATPSTSLTVLVILMIVGVFLYGLFQVFTMRETEKIQQRIFARLTFIYAYRLPRLDLKHLDDYFLPELVNRFFDTASLQKGISKILLDFPTAIIQILFGLILISLYHPIFITFGVLLILIVIAMLYATSPAGFKTSIKESDYKYHLAHWLEEISRSIRTFKFFQKHQLHLKKTDQLVSGYLDARNNHFKILIFQYWTIIGFKVIITAAMLIIGSWLLIDQKINLGQFVAAEVIILLILNSVEKIISSLDVVFDVLTSVDKIHKVIEKPQDQNLKRVPTPIQEMTKKPISIDITDLSFGYVKEKYVLNKVNLSIQAGEKIGITGADGSGKTTLLKLLTGMYPDFKGNIRLNDVPINNISSDFLRDNIAVFFAQEELFEGTLWDNLTVGNPEISIEEVNHILDIVGLKTFVNGQNSGFNTSIETQGAKLPHHIVHKILIARCLLMKPSLLLMEDGWTNIETELRNKIINYLMDDKNFTLIAVSADQSFMSKCDRVIEM